MLLKKRSRVLLGALLLSIGSIVSAGLPPRISWTPPKLDLGQLLPDSNTTMTVVLKHTGILPIGATKQLRIVVEGPLSSYLTVTQPSFPSVFKHGNQVNVPVVVSIPANAIPGNKSGTLILKRILPPGKELEVWRANPLPISLTVGAGVPNQPPLSNAGESKTVSVGSTVVLDGSLSSDPDGNQLSYQWSFKTIPSSSTAQLSSPSSVHPSFIPDKEGDYVVQLIVSDGKVSGAPSQTTITAIVDAKQQIKSLEDQGLIPKLDRSADIHGKDVNNNGIRDDIDDFIENNYTATPQRNAAEQFARVVQEALIADKNDSSAAKSIAIRGSQAVNCIYSRFDGNSGGKLPAAVVEELEAVSANTKARLLAYLAYSKALDGTAGALPEGDTCE